MMQKRAAEMIIGPEPLMTKGYSIWRVLYEKCLKDDLIDT